MSFKGRRTFARNGWRSGLEEKVGAFLTGNQVSYQYEQHKIRYLVPERSASYTPDYVLPNGIVLETKGQFDVDDRKKHLLIKTQHPLIDIRFVFSNSNTRIYPASPTTYAMWCQNHGFIYSDKTPPISWLIEPPNTERMDALLASSKGSQQNAET